MSSITFADNKTGGRFTAAADAIAAGHLNRAAGILAEVADELNVEATEAGLLSEEVEAPVVPPPETYGKPPMPLGPPAEPVDLQMCGRGVHSFGPSDPISGWRECAVCGQVNVSPPEDNGFVDMSSRQ
jgi:hypothetical protein